MRELAPPARMKAFTGLAPRQEGADLQHSHLRILDLDDQLVVALVMEFDHNRLLRVMNVPEDALAVLIKGACGDNAGDLGAGHADAVQPTAGDLRICADAGDVLEGNFE